MDTSSTQEAKASISEILKMLPHRFPFLLIDRVLSCEPKKAARVLKNFTASEWYFSLSTSDSPPLVPTYITLEVMAQACCILSYYSGHLREGSSIHLAGVDNCTFEKPITPGAVMVVDVVLKRSLRGVGKYQTKAVVDGNLVAQADITAVVGP